MSTAALLVLSAALQASAPPPPPPAIEALLGAWEGVAQHQGETSPVIVEFVRRNDVVWTVFSFPAIHAWRFPIGHAEMSGTTIRVGPAAFEYDPAARQIATTLPAELVPKYSLRVTLRPRDAVAAPTRPPFDVPARLPRWVRDLGSPIWADVTTAAGLVLAATDAGQLHAVDPRTGEDRWILKTGGAIRARPIAIDQDVVVQSDDGAVYRVDMRTGAQKWRAPIGPAVRRVPVSDPASRYDNRASAVAHAGNRLFVGTHDGRILAVDAEKGTIVWEHKTGDSVIATPVVASGRVFCGSMDGKIYALDAANGTRLWTHDTGAAVTSAVALHKNLVLAGSRSYDFQALDAATGSPVWTQYFWFSWVESPATVHQGIAYIGSSDAARVSAFDAASGKRVWTSDVRGSAWSQPAVTATHVYEAVAGVTNYIAPHEGRVVALDRATGRPVWQFAATPPAASTDRKSVAFGFAASVAVNDDAVFAGGLDGRLYAFDR
jgi:outer membrane protein assembly factor BamB